MSASPQILVLFDIDGTLIHTARAGLRGMNAAFRRLHGRDHALDGVSFAGRTDRAIAADVFRNVGLEPTDAAIVALRDAYLEDLRIEMARPVADPGGVFPGVPGLLDALEARDDVAVGLLTGNFAGGAAIKLGHFDLWRRFAFGAFGDDHHDRRDLVPVALTRARELGYAVDAASTVIIGDTPLDIDCAHAHGARAIAVATGPFTPAQLAHADLVVETLEAVDAAAVARRWR
ncbi:MAG TPA: HAD hydrolase-like protein [Vicinamibacterales bacterium]|nr:HAD hydrolase-like protein [Vicinamibacterales bacterium]